MTHTANRCEENAIAVANRNAVALFASAFDRSRSSFPELRQSQGKPGNGLGHQQ